MQLKNLILIVRNHTSLDDRKAIEERTKNSGETIKKLFWQFSINEQRQKLTIRINDIVIEGLIDTGVGITILAFKLTSSGGKCSVVRDWNFISSKRECEMGLVYSTRGQV